MRADFDLDELRRLEPDWNTYGALAISEKAIQKAREIDFVPTVIDADGQIESIYWSRP